MKQIDSVRRFTVKYPALVNSQQRNLDVQQFKLYFSSLRVTLIDFSAFEAVADRGVGEGMVHPLP